jgi:hypothetical protein
MVGVATDTDDDGNEASTQKASNKNGKSQAQKPSSNKVESPEDLLKIINRVDKVNNYFRDIQQLRQAIVSGLGVEQYDWPAKTDVEGWRTAYSVAKDYAVSAAEMDQTA